MTTPELIDPAEIGFAANEAFAVKPRPPEAIFQLLYGRSRGDGIIAIGALRPNLDGNVGVRYWLPLSVTNWQPLLPGVLSFRDDLTKYICPNTLDKRALMGRDHGEFIDKLHATNGTIPKKFNSTTANVKELNAIWVDLDVYKNTDGLDNAGAFGIVMAKIARGELPWPSLVAYSGRGSYYLWLLKEPDSLEPPLVTDHTTHLWDQVISETIRRTEDLESDRTAAVMSKWLKLPGTIDSKSGNQVMYMTMGMSEPNRVPIYTLEQLAKNYGLLEPQLPEGPLQIPAPAPAPTRPKKKGPGTPHGGNPAAPYEKRYFDMERLAQERGGIPKGTRSTRLLSYFFAVRAAVRMSIDREAAHDIARKRTIDFNARYCKPPLPGAEVTKCTPFRRNKREAAISHLVRVWKVTSAEARDHELRALVPSDIREERRQAQRASAMPKHERRALIDGLILEGKTNTEIFMVIDKRYRYTVSKRRKKLNLLITHRQEKLPIDA